MITATDQDKWSWFLASANSADVSFMIGKLEANRDFRSPAALQMLDALRRHRDSLVV
ncbi:hypothetical protein [Falsirhodobacter sp. 20TX0035]|uniref:hypothetical protein n=1 Tax=Falsirhodobacter sp. 20TX0035 TaxID=3022019 RepID=UPI00232B34E6|nr:hypothetical protein [Falsirhodobacter sp. 20TX0035]MDB6454684.1 hypothetical protein [Falsirhodobacter sp. 20TX0035]